MLLGKIISALVPLVVVVISIDSSAAPQPEIAVPPPAQETGATAQNGLAEHLTVDQARELVARMSDREVRELLLKQLETLRAEIQPARDEPVSMFFNVQENMYVMRNRLRETLAAVPELPSIGPFIVMRITKGYE